MPADALQADPATVLDSIEARLNFLRADSEPPFVYAQEPPPGMPQRAGQYEERRVVIRDGRRLASSLSLDEQGFVLRPVATAVADFYDDAEVKRVYYPEIERLLKKETGARKIVIFDHTVRNTARGQVGQAIREAATTVHNDYTEKSGPQRVRDLLDRGEAERRLQHRYAEINVWRPIAGPVEAWPLAVADARSIDAGDLVPSERRYPDRIGEIYAVVHNPRQRWFYFPRMRRDEALLIKCFDSARDGRARLSIHSAFADPTTRADAPPRESIEVRAFVFF
jgi:hypothetical protein